MVEEVERRPDVIVLVHCIPLLADGTVTGAMILLRDVTDVRRLDRLLLSKDAAIREVHHRVKNNLQTISSLLSLQARRVEPGEGREALREAERRVRSIALVHEILSREPGDQVPFDEIVGSLVQMAEDSVVSSRPVEISVDGRPGRGGRRRGHPAGRHPGRAAAERRRARLRRRRRRRRRPAAPGGPREAGHVEVTLEDGEAHELPVAVDDDGCGLPEGFDIERRPAWGCRSSGTW